MLLMVFLPVEAIGAVVGAWAALLIAFVAYPWQKHQDRLLQISLEERAALRDFFDSLSKFQSAVRSGDFERCDREMSSLKSCFNNLMLYAPASTIKPAREAIDRVCDAWAIARRDEGHESDLAKFSENFWDAIRLYRQAETAALLVSRRSVRPFTKDDETVMQELYKDTVVKVD
ncbi:hypothetical protein [Paracoccus sp. NSM]|uniref:hypothetical protein n=1 Tax=Paracoccus sp. NSM TaxID=3457784 RepID=UPI00403740F3